MTARNLPPLAEEALHDVEICDVAGDMAARIEQLESLKKTARLRGEEVNRAQLALCITGEDRAAALALADAYAKALHGYDITIGRDGCDGPVALHVKWQDLVSDADGKALTFRKAGDAVYSAKSDAEGGVLVIEDMYDEAPRETSELARDQARNGALQILSGLFEEYAEKNYTPVVVLIGAPGKTRDYLAKHRGVAEWFNGRSIRAGEMPPAPVPTPSVEVEAALQVGRPLALKKPKPGQV
jgi:hypothetical protein